jgi:predicted PurR-regulated permease PerM
VLSLVGLAVVLGAYGLVAGTRGQALGIGLALDVVAFVLAVVARRRGRRRNHRARALAPVVVLLTIAFVGFGYFVYPHASADLIDQARGLATHLANLVQHGRGSA